MIHDGRAESSGFAGETAALLEQIRAEVLATESYTGRHQLHPAVLTAMRRTPRHQFVSEEQASAAYIDAPLSIGHGQTISQPFIVALMTDLAEVGKGSRVLEVGTGSGYQAAVLAELGCEVYSVERVNELAVTAKHCLERLGYDRVHVKVGDGYFGWQEHAPYNAILITAAIAEPPAVLLEQLRTGGRMVLPLGAPYDGQDLTVITRLPEDGFESRLVLPVSFVPFVHEDSSAR